MTHLLPTQAPRRLPGDGFWRKTWAVLVQERSDLARSVLAALRNTDYFKVTQLPRSEAEVDQLLASGTVLFAIEIPANFERPEAPAAEDWQSWSQPTPPIR